MIGGTLEPTDYIVGEMKEVGQARARPGNTRTAKKYYSTIVTGKQEVVWYRRAVFEESHGSSVYVDEQRLLCASFSW